MNMDPAFFDDRNVLVTGGLGFIGSHLSERLNEMGANVTILDAYREDSGANKANVSGFVDEVELVTGDVGDFETVRCLVAETDLVFHLAAQVSRVDSMQHPKRDIETNFLGTLNILRAAADVGTEPHVVFASSRAVYGAPDTLPVTEEADTSPVDVYGANKLVGEKYCAIFNGRGLSTSVARLNNVYGPRAQIQDTNYGVINVFVRRAVEGEPLTVFRPGTTERDLVYVGDVVEALLYLADADRTSGEVYNVGSGDGISIRGIAERIVSIAGTGNVEIVDWPDDWEEMKIGDFVADNNKIRELGWEPVVDIDSGLEETIRFYDSHLEQYV